MVIVSAARRLGRYELGEIIGTGGVAEVVRARIVGAGEFRKDVVVKRLRTELRDDAEARAGFVREAMLAQRLHHGNIVQTLDFGDDDDGRPYIVLELVEGCTLQRLLDDVAAGGPPIPLEVTLHVVEQIAVALQYVHVARGDDDVPLGLVHRDVKPANVLLGRGGVVKLSDFGIARAAAMGSDTLPGFIKGTALYLAPEQAAGRPIDARVDVFALGLVLRRLLVGDAELDAVSPELAAIVLAATEPAVRDRMPSAEALLVRLQQHRATLGLGSGATALAALVDTACGTKPPRVLALDRALGGEAPARTRQLAPSPEALAIARGSNLSRAKRWPWVLGAVAIAIALFIAWPRAPAPQPIAIADDPPSAPAEQAPAPAPAPASPAPTPAPIEPPSPSLIDEPPPSSPRERPRARGRLKVNLVPYAEVSIDGRSLGGTPVDEPIRAGAHELELYNPDSGLRRTLDVTIEEGRVLNITRW
jgi:serine/threonine-protein kinase